jgi:alpha-1,6-mannosyltransferase
MISASVTGFIGSTCVAVGALGAGWLPVETDLLTVPIIGMLRDGATGSLLARGFVLVGLALVLQAWLVLGTNLAHAPLRLSQVRWILLAWSAPLMLTPPLFSRDAYSYYAQGRLLASGEDPTLVGVASIPGWFTDGVDPMWAESPTPYGPAWLGIARVVADITHPNATLAAFGMRLAVVLGVVLLAWAVPALAEMHGIDPARALWLGVLNPLVLMHLVSGAHNDALMAGLVAAGLVISMRQYCMWGAAVIGLAIAIKPIAVVVLPFTGLLWAGRGSGWGRRIRAWAMSLLTAGIVVLALMAVTSAGAGLLQAMFGTPSSVLTWLSPSTALGQGVGLATTALGITSDASVALSLVRLGFAAAAIAAIALMALAPNGRSPVRSAGIALLLVVILGPVVQPWYLLWALPLLAATGLTSRQMRIAVLTTAIFTVHAMVEVGATADSTLDITDALNLVLAAAVVSLIAFASPRERRLMLATDPDMALLPTTRTEREMAALATWGPTGRISA